MRISKQIYTTPQKEFYNALLMTGIFGVFGVIGAMNSSFRGTGASDLTASKWKGTGLGFLAHFGVLGCTYLLGFLLVRIIPNYSVVRIISFVLSVILWIAIVHRLKGRQTNVTKQQSGGSAKE